MYLHLIQNYFIIVRLSILVQLVMMIMIVMVHDDDDGDIPCTIYCGFIMALSCNTVTSVTQC